jgi:flotillin
LIKVNIYLREAKMFGISFGQIILFVVIAVLVVVAYLVARRAYFRVPPNKVLVVYGRGKTIFSKEGLIERSGVRLLTGGGGVIFPFLEAHDTLDLTVMTIAVAKDEVYTVDGVPIKLDWVAQVQIASDELSLLTAARAFLGRGRDEVKSVITQTLSANFRAIVGQLTVEDVHRDRDAFVTRVSELAEDDMSAMGVQVISMGIEEITDDQGYFEAMAAPQIAAVKRDASIAEAEADREARVKAADAGKEAEQAELDAKRAIIEQSEALNLREVAKDKTVRLAQAEADEAVQKRRALVVKEQQEVEVLVPARAEREAVEINADAEKRKMTIAAEAEAAVKLKEADAQAESQRRVAEGQADAIRSQANAEADATERTGKAEASKLQDIKEAEARGVEATLTAQAEGTRAQGLAEAEATKATLLAEAKGKRELADATAAQNEINLRETVARMIIEAEVKKMEAIGAALGGIGENVKIVQISGANDRGNGNALIETLRSIPELATVINAQTEALTGDNLEELFARLAKMLAGSKKSEEADPTIIEDQKNDKDGDGQ